MQNILGFTWDSSVIPTEFPTCSVERALFRLHKMHPEFVWDAAVLENSPFTFPEVKTLLDGITVGGRRVSDQELILNLAASHKELARFVKDKSFVLHKQHFTQLHSIVARNEALEWGHFRGEGQEVNYTPNVGLGEKGVYTPLPTVEGAAELIKLFHSGINCFNSVTNPLERALTFFLFGALQQFFFDGNKRTSRLMMNGVLLSSGIDAISIPAARALEFNEKMVDFYVNRDGTEMLQFLLTCSDTDA